jgi:nicotinamidase-related amidase
MMTSTCVDSSVRAASDLGFAVQLVHDACAAPNLEFNGVHVSASVHAAFIAALGDGFASLRSSAEIITG